MGKREIILRLDQRWYDALSADQESFYLGRDVTLEDKLNEFLDTMISGLPEQVRGPIIREIQREDELRHDQREFSVFRVTQDGVTDHLLAEDSMYGDVLVTAEALDSYLLRKTRLSPRFTKILRDAVAIPPEKFQEYAKGLPEYAGRVAAVLDIDLDRGKFSMLEAADDWSTYTFDNVSAAVWYARPRPWLDCDRRRDHFIDRLKAAKARCDRAEYQSRKGPDGHRSTGSCQTAIPTDPDAAVPERAQEETRQVQRADPFLRGVRPLRPEDLAVFEFCSAEDHCLTFCLDVLADEKTVFGRQLSDQREGSCIAPYVVYDGAKGAVRNRMDVALILPYDEKWFHCQLSSEVRVSLKEKMDAFCVEQYGEHLSEMLAQDREGPRPTQMELSM